MPPDFQDPTRRSTLKECDLVMKGGITSGVVYPPLVIRLSKTYRFRSLGGTSAGAIAAALTAAAEYGRAQGGFQKLEDVREWLSKDGHLRNLFQPSNQTRALMDTLFDITKAWKEKAPAYKGGLKGFLRYVPDLRRALRSHDSREYTRGVGMFCGIGLITALILAVALSLILYLTLGLLSWRVSFVLFLTLGVMLGALGWRIGGLIKGVSHLLKIALKDIPNNYYGLCTGRKGNDEDKNNAALTDWLAATINRLAGREENCTPLTFRDLWGTEVPGKERNIDLKMVTSNLSQGQPYVLPFAKDLFLFSKRDFDHLFPEDVVRHMVSHARKYRGLEIPEEYYFLPRAADLPVVVATRMSLSFPLLISAVPLYTISQKVFEKTGNAEIDIEEGSEQIALKRREKKGSPGEHPPPVRLAAADLQRNWFSDGGICSNFPIHFFDAWLPRRPTFGVNLTSLPDGEIRKHKRVGRQHFSVSPKQTRLKEGPNVTTAGNGDEDVFLPRADEHVSPSWVELASLPRFLWSIFATAQNFRDNSQAMLPSYRERIVHIRLSDKEGGLNLAMTPVTIEKVVEKGARAGEKLETQFDFERHQWVRLRVLMGQMEESLKKMFLLLEANQEFRCRDLLHKQEQEPTYPYRLDPPWGCKAWERLEAMGTPIRRWADEEVFVTCPPLPRPVLRVTPESP